MVGEGGRAEIGSREVVQARNSVSEVRTSARGRGEGVNLGMVVG